MGLNAVDQILLLDRYPPRGGKEAIRDSRILPGGQVATAMVTCRALGLDRVRYVGKVGDDEFGRLSRQSLIEKGVDCRHVLTEPGIPNQSAVIAVDGRTGERTIFWQRSDRLNFRPGELSPEAIRCAPVLLLDGHDEDAALWCARQAKEAGMLTVLDIDKVRTRTREILPLIDFCLTSETFPRDLSGEAGLEKALAGVARFCPGLVGATLGPAGVAIRWQGRLETVTGYPVDCVDSTGAGDVFHGAFIFSLLQGWPLGRMLRFANAAAALNCTAFGARGGIRPAAQVLAYMADR